nr:MAG TPA: hypothetical protein [Caudoviricetes sp.]
MHHLIIEYFRKTDYPWKSNICFSLKPDCSL